MLALGLSLLWLSRRKRRLVRAGLVVAAGVLNFVSVYWFIAAPGHFRPIRASYSAAGLTAPDLLFERLTDHSKSRLSDYRGKVVVLNLWSTWCGPCRAEMPDLDRLHRDFASRGAVVVAVSDEPFEVIGQYEALKTMMLVAARTDAATAPPQLFVATNVMRPITHIVDRDGVLRETLLGAQRYESVVSKILPYLP